MGVYGSGGIKSHLQNRARLEKPSAKSICKIRLQKCHLQNPSAKSPLAVGVFFIFGYNDNKYPNLGGVRPMSREEMIKFIRSAAKEIEGVHLPFNYFLQFTDEQLDRECDWYEYLLTK